MTRLKFVLLAAIAAILPPSPITAAATSLPRAAFLGGSAADGAWPTVAASIAADGSILLAGYTASTDLPVTAGAYQPTFDASGPGAQNAFVARVRADLGTLEACTYFGVSDGVEGIAVVSGGAGGDVWLLGQTQAADLPATAGAYDGAPSGGRDLFLARLDRDLTTLKACTYLGGAGHDVPRGLAWSEPGRLYVIGTTRSADFPTSPGAYDRAYAGGTDIFVACLSANLDTLVAATYLGGSLDDEGALALSEGGVWVVGSTRSSNYPTTAGAYDRTFNGAMDVCVSRLSLDLTTLLASTFVGGTGWDFGYCVAVAPDGSIYAGGHAGPGFPTPGGYDTTYNGGPDGYDDIFVCRLPADLGRLDAGTYLGGSQFDHCTALVTGPAGDVYAGGYTRSTNFPLAGAPAIDQHAGGRDAYAARLSADLSTLRAATFLGGGGDESEIRALSLGSCLVLAGCTDSASLPGTAGTFGPAAAGSGDLFAALLDTSLGAVDLPTAVPANGLPRLGLHPVQPNPFNPRAVVSFDLAEPAAVRLTIHDQRGRTVRTLADGQRGAGRHAALWDGCDDRGRPAPAGAYVVRLRAGAEQATRKAALVR